MKAILFDQGSYEIDAAGARSAGVDAFLADPLSRRDERNCQRIAIPDLLAAGVAAVRLSLRPSFSLLVLAAATFGAACAARPSGDGSASAPKAERPGIDIGWTAARCTTAPDADADGVADGCETALAAGFAPLMRVDDRECGWDARSGRLGGGYLYAVGRPAGSERVRIAYLPAYHVDCGWQAPACVVKPGMCRPHTGDSEAVVVEVAFDAASSRWRTEAVFLSAHCHGRSDGRCRWFRGAELATFAWVDGAERGAPVVWVARGKHASYPSRRACDSGYWYVESCDGNRAAYRFPVVHPGQNAGSRSHPFGAAGGSDCIAADSLHWAGVDAVPGTTECIWREDGEFRGWMGRALGSSPAPYGRYLRERAEL